MIPKGKNRVKKMNLSNINILFERDLKKLIQRYENTYNIPIADKVQFLNIAYEKPIEKPIEKIVQIEKNEKPIEKPIENTIFEQIEQIEKNEKPIKLPLKPRRVIKEYNKIIEPNGKVWASEKSRNRALFLHIQFGHYKSQCHLIDKIPNYHGDFIKLVSKKYPKNSILNKDDKIQWVPMKNI